MNRTLINKQFHSNGKLLLTGEYLVMKGAKALAIPLNLGQHLSVTNSNNSSINWVSFENTAEILKTEFDLTTLQIKESSDRLKSEYIQKLLLAAKSLNNTFLSKANGFEIRAGIEFNMQWGLGSSSTLINNIALWANVSPFELNSKVSKGSGYDIACASAETPIMFRLINGTPIIESVQFTPPFIDNLSLVYLNAKMATENNIKEFAENNSNYGLAIKQISELSDSFLKCSYLHEFMELMKIHESIISEIIGQKTVKWSRFNDFNGEVKSLGAWGGDFILAASEENFEKQKDYFNNKGFTTVIPLKSMLKA